MLLFLFFKPLLSWRFSVDLAVMAPSLWGRAEITSPIHSRSWFCIGLYRMWIELLEFFVCLLTLKSYGSFHWPLALSYGFSSLPNVVVREWPFWWHCRLLICVIHCATRRHDHFTSCQSLWAPAFDSLKKRLSWKSQFQPQLILEFGKISPRGGRRVVEILIGKS